MFEKSASSNGGGKRAIATAKVIATSGATKRTCETLLSQFFIVQSGSQSGVKSPLQSHQLSKGHW